MITSGLTPKSGGGEVGGTTAESLSATGESGLAGTDGSLTAGANEGGSDGVPGSMTVATQSTLMGLVR